MQENPTGSNMPVYASLSTMRQEPSQEEMNNGVIPLDTLPATWWNWMWNAITQAQNDSMYNDDVLFTEINNVLAAAGITPGTSQQHDQLRQAIMVIKDTIATTAAAGSVLSTDGGTTGTVKVGADGKMTVNNFGDIALFHGATKNNLIGAVNETYDIAFDNKDNIGEVGALTTIERNTLVGAINELDAGKAPKAHASAETTYGIGSATNYGHVKLTDTPSSDDASSGTAATPGLVQSMISGGLGSVNSVGYTYVVDSNQKLSDWANNVTTAGQDYTSVLIRKGEWTSDTGINLSTTGTKAVVGEADSKLVFNSVREGLSYASVPNTADYYMQGVSVEVINERADGTGSVRGRGFYKCTNLTNCTGTVTALSDDSSEGYGFYNCTNLTNCIGTGTVTLSGPYGNGGGYGFYNCTNLTNCIGTGTVTATYGDGYGFYNCTNLTNCIGTGTVTLSGDGYGYGCGFNYCSNLTNCIGTGTVTITYDTGSGDGYGFYNCNCVICCKAEKYCTTAVFERSYASAGRVDTYACADTANGGFNNTINPAA